MHMGNLHTHVFIIVSGRIIPFQLVFLVEHGSWCTKVVSEFWFKIFLVKVNKTCVCELTLTKKSSQNSETTFVHQSFMYY
jgi:hypothetical protein